MSYWSVWVIILKWTLERKQLWGWTRCEGKGWHSLIQQTPSNENPSDSIWVKKICNWLDANYARWCQWSGKANSAREWAAEFEWALLEALQMQEESIYYICMRRHRAKQKVKTKLSCDWKVRICILSLCTCLVKSMLFFFFLRDRWSRVLAPKNRHIQMHSHYFMWNLTFYSTDTLDTVPDLHIVALKWHEDSVRVIGLPLCVNLWVAVLELKPVVAVVLHYFAVYFKVFFHPAEGKVDLAALASALDGRFVIDQAVNFLILDPASSPNDRWRLWRLRRVLLAADARVPHLGAGSHKGSARQEAKRSVTGAAVP